MCRNPNRLLGGCGILIADQLQDCALDRALSGDIELQVGVPRVTRAVRSRLDLKVACRSEIAAENDPSRTYVSALGTSTTVVKSTRFSSDSTIDMFDTGRIEMSGEAAWRRAVFRDGALGGRKGVMFLFPD